MYCVILRWLSEDSRIKYHQQQTEAILTPRKRRQSLPVNMSIEPSNHSVWPSSHRDGLPVNHLNTSVSSGMPKASHRRRHSLQPIGNISKPLRNIDKYNSNSDPKIVRPLLPRKSLSKSIHDWMLEQNLSPETDVNYSDSWNCLEDRHISSPEHFKLPTLISDTEARNNNDRGMESKTDDKINLCHALQNASKPKVGRRGRRQTIHVLTPPLERVVSGKILSLPEDKNEFDDCAIISQTEEMKARNSNRLRRVSLPMMHLEQHRAPNGTELKTGKEKLLIEQEIERLKINDRCRKNSRIFSYVED